MAHYGHWTVAFMGSIPELENEAYVVVYDHQKRGLLAEPLKVEGFRECTQYNWEYRQSQIRIHVAGDRIAVEY